eukprot:SAG11_NODE_1365_length_5109_cov_2.411976_1_plen_212_part_10
MCCLSTGLASQRSLPSKQLKLNRTAKPAKLSSNAAANKGRKTYYDSDAWTEKQERCFAKWLSYVLQPPIASLDSRNPGDIMTAERQGISLKDIDAQLQQFRLQKKGYQLLTDPEVRECIIKLKQELDAERVTLVRSDTSLKADVRIHDLCVSHVMSYNPAWLRFGLEAVYAETLECDDEDEQFLSQFVKQRLMNDVEIARAYKFEKQFKELN